MPDPDRQSSVQAMIELDFIKRELYDQIDSNGVMNSEIETWKGRYLELEEEMQLSIEGYQKILSQQHEQPNIANYQSQMSDIPLENDEDGYSFEGQMRKRSSSRPQLEDGNGPMGPGIVIATEIEAD